MSQKIVVDKQYMLHEGGTKFYQVLRVVATNPVGVFGPAKLAVTIKHWGPQKGPGTLMKIASCGQWKVEEGDHYSSWIREKKARGYQGAITDGRTTALTSPEKLREYLTTEVGAEQAANLMLMLGFDKRAKVDPSDDVDTSPAVVAARKAKAPEREVDTSSMPDWGSF